MRLHSLAIRLALPLAMIGMTAVGAASPAQAEAVAEPPEVEIFVPDRVVTTDGSSKSVPFEVVNVGEIAVTGVVLDFGAVGSPVDPRVGFQPPAGCTATSCSVGDLAPGARKGFTFTVKPTAELPAVGVSFSLTAHDASGEWEVSTPVTVVRAAAPGIDLEVAGIPDIKLAAGKSAVLPIAVRNNGNKPTEAGVAVALAAQPYITFPNNYSNCVDVDDLPGIVCVFDLQLDPGAVFTMSPSTPLVVAADRATPGPADYYSGMYAFGLEETDDADLAAALKAAKKPGTKLELVRAAKSLDVDQSELNDWDNSTSFFVKVPLNPADSVAIGDTFKGKIGDISTVQVGFRNAGPATVLPRSKDWVHSARVRTPSGLALTKVDKRCVPNGDGDPSWDLPGRISGHEYLCLASKPLAAGEKELFSFSGKIEDGENEDEGTIRVRGGVQDKNAANDEAKVDVKVTAAGGGSDDGGSGGGLPITGAPTGQVAGVGLLLVLSGALALVLTRRRRTA